ncbi:MAG: aminofutalosine synthase MqnE [Nitrospinota bacterium]
MNINSKKLRQIYDKVLNSERLSFEDGITLDESNELLAIGMMANYLREKLHADNAYYINNRHINHTNICVNECKFCAFRKSIDDPEGYLMTIDDVMAKAKEWEGESFSEFHIVGGLHPDLGYDYYRGIISSLHTKYPDIHIQGFTAVEIGWFAKIANISYREVLEDLKSVGLGSLPGGGAEIFNESIRSKICPDIDKVSSEEWLTIHKIAHDVGLRSNATMLYGHIETAADRIDHLIRLRAAQDESGGFMTFIPLAFHPKNTKYDSKNFTSGILDLKMIAISRLMLDNIEHIKAFWIMIGEQTAQVALSFGADDMDGTVVEEKITHAAGATTNEELAVEKLESLISEAGRKAVARDTVYNLV